MVGECSLRRWRRAIGVQPHSPTREQLARDAGPASAPAFPAEEPTGLSAAPIPRRRIMGGARITQARGGTDQRMPKQQSPLTRHRQCGQSAKPVAGTVNAMGIQSSLVENNRDAITATARAHKAASIAVFGSVARGDDTPTSDIDFLVEFEPGSSLFDLLHLQDALEALLGCSVDVISAGGLTDRDDHIRTEAVTL